ncbi:MAG TPA: hypothetical protein VNI57_06690, partial [Candidatus Saccharimonadales bacterium]|nr:hypothetical protein [Candidatus Saccharimonadales bacterium]
IQDGWFCASSVSIQKGLSGEKGPLQKFMGVLTSDGAVLLSDSCEDSKFSGARKEPGHLEIPVTCPAVAFPDSAEKDRMIAGIVEAAHATLALEAELHPGAETRQSTIVIGNFRPTSLYTFLVIQPTGSVYSVVFSEPDTYPVRNHEYVLGEINNRRWARSLRKVILKDNIKIVLDSKRGVQSGK